MGEGMQGHGAPDSPSRRFFLPSLHTNFNMRLVVSRDECVEHGLSNSMWAHVCMCLDGAN
jgi:hypothetical protein